VRATAREGRAVSSEAPGAKAGARDASGRPRLHLDHNAGGRVRPEVAAALAEWLGRDAANPSSLHAAGRRARAAVEEARERVAALVGAEPAEIVFTSGGTEANALALAGSLGRGARSVTTEIEHVSVLGTLERLARERGVEVRRVAPDPEGWIGAAALAAALDRGVALVSIGWANGEAGTIQPIAGLAAVIRDLAPGALLHADAVQAVGLCRVDVRAADLDLLSLSGHKIGALPGVGALFVRRGLGLEPLWGGGPQERERRPGTENVPGIVSLGLAAEIARREREGWARRAARLREGLWRGLAERAAPVRRLGPADGDGLPSTLSVSFLGLRGDALVVALDLEGVAASTGSACAAGAAEPSHVFRALGLGEEVAAGALRLSFGPELSERDVGLAIDRIAAVVARARRAPGSVGGRAA